MNIKKYLISFFLFSFLLISTNITALEYLNVRVYVSTNSARVVWVTNFHTPCHFTILGTKGGTVMTEHGYIHYMNISGLKENTKYIYVIEARDKDMAIVSYTNYFITKRAIKKKSKVHDLKKYI